MEKTIFSYNTQKIKASRMKIIVILLSLTLMSYPHSGRLDKKGGHENHQTGKYHLHTGKSTKNKSIDTNIRIEILKYNSSYGWGSLFSSIEDCEREKVKLTKANAGLDYSYVCAIK